ncbi:unnamed protein product [Musa acuminata subsp. burmannicoides]
MTATRNSSQRPCRPESAGSIEGEEPRGRCTLPYCHSPLQVPPPFPEVRAHQGLPPPPPGGEERVQGRRPPGVARERREPGGAHRREPRHHLVIVWVGVPSSRTGLLHPSAQQVSSSFGISHSSSFNGPSANNQQETC